jgi:hypothetical protein
MNIRRLVGQDWVEGDPFPEIEIMKWTGDDATRSEALERYVEKGLSGLGTRDAANVDALRTTVVSVRDGIEEDASVSGDAAANPRGAADRSARLAPRSREFATTIVQATRPLRWSRAAYLSTCWPRPSWGGAVDAQVQREGDGRRPT